MHVKMLTFAILLCLEIEMWHMKRNFKKQLYEEGLGIHLSWQPVWHKQYTPHSRTLVTIFWPDETLWINLHQICGLLLWMALQRPWKQHISRIQGSVLYTKCIQAQYWALSVLRAEHMITVVMHIKQKKIRLEAKKDTIKIQVYMFCQI